MFKIHTMQAVLLLGQQRVSAAWHEDNSFINVAFVLLPWILCGRKLEETHADEHANSTQRAQPAVRFRTTAFLLRGNTAPTCCPIIYNNNS